MTCIDMTKGNLSDASERAMETNCYLLLNRHENFKIQIYISFKIFSDIKYAMLGSLRDDPNLSLPILYVEIENRTSNLRDLLFIY